MHNPSEPLHVHTFHRQTPSQHAPDNFMHAPTMLLSLQALARSVNLHLVFPWLLRIGLRLQPELEPQTTARPAMRPSQQQARLLQVLPPELILQISFHVNEADAIALSLSCTATHKLLFRNAMGDLNKLLEKADKEVQENHTQVLRDLGDGPYGRYVDTVMASLERHLPSCYYCARCQKLHKYAQITTPTIRWDQQPHSHRCWLTMVDVPQQTFSITHSGVRLGYHHGRLAMNRHFYGEQTGLPLAFLNSEQLLDYPTMQPLRHLVGTPTWKRTCTFKVSQNELILQMILELSSTNLESLLCALEQQDCDLCCHVTTAGRCRRSHGRMRVPSLEALDFRSLSSLTWGHCRQCVTDYFNHFKCEYQPPFHPTKEPTFTVSISGYHLLGDFRHPLDKKWRAFMAGRNPMLYFEDSPWDPINEMMGQWRFMRDMKEYPEGEIHRRWMAAGQQ